MRRAHVVAVVVQLLAALSQPCTGTFTFLKQQQWRYWSGTTAVSPQWTATAFDDSGWGVGKGPLGFGYSGANVDGSAITAIPVPHSPTIYFRATVSLDCVDGLDWTVTGAFGECADDVAW